MPVNVVWVNNMEEQGLCAFCDNKETDNGGPYEMNDEYACGDCYQNAVERAKWMYESARDEGLI